MDGISGFPSYYLKELGNKPRREGEFMALGQGWGEGGLGTLTSKRQELERNPQTKCLLWIEFCLSK